MKPEDRINAFVQLGTELEAVLAGNPHTEAGKKLLELLPVHVLSNGWFTEGNLRHRLGTIAATLKKDALQDWLSAYPRAAEEKSKTVSVILAGNIPLVGFDDFRCVLCAGFVFSGKLSSDDKFMLPLLAQILIEAEPRFGNRISFTENRLSAIDAVIATGSNNSSRYFEHYFSKYPHIIRRNRNSVAVLSGDETREELTALGEDIFRYFGLGCRSVTKFYVPENYRFDAFFESIYNWGDETMGNKKYMNNYEYNKTVYLLNKLDLLDNNFLLLKEDIGIASPPGVVFYERYGDAAELRRKLSADRALIQCIVSRPAFDPAAVAFGQSQQTSLRDYADGVDVMQFLSEL